MLTLDSIRRCMQLDRVYGERGEPRSIGAMRRATPPQAAKSGGKTVRINVRMGQDPETGEHRMVTD
jgi:hypothetical protein